MSDLEIWETMAEAIYLRLREPEDKRTWAEVKETLWGTQHVIAADEALKALRAKGHVTMRVMDV